MIWWRRPQRTEAKTHLENLLKNPHTPRGSWFLLWPYNRWHGHQPKTDSIRFDTGHTSSMSKRCGRAGRLFLTECDAVVGNISGIRSWIDRRLGVCNKKPWAHGQHLEENRKSGRNVVLEIPKQIQVNSIASADPSLSRWHRYINTILMSTSSSKPEPSIPNQSNGLCQLDTLWVNDPTWRWLWIYGMKGRVTLRH